MRLFPSRRLVLLAAALLPAPTASFAAPAPSDVVARQGTITMTAGDVNALLARLDPQTRARVENTPGALVDVVRRRLATEALLAEANAKNWAQRPEIAAQIADARTQVIGQTYLASVSAPDAAYPSDAEIASAYAQNKAQFLLPRAYHLAQIATQAAADDEGKRRAVLAAKGFPAAKSTDLGWLPEDRLPPTITQAVAGLPVGGVSDPVHLGDGWHVFKLLATRPATTESLQDARPQIVAALRNEKAQANARAYIAKLQQSQHAEINEIALNAAVGK